RYTSPAKSDIRSSGAMVNGLRGASEGFTDFPTFRIRGERQPHLERRSSRFGLDSHLAAMLLRDAINRIEPESRPLAEGLAGKKRLENTVTDFRRYPRTVVPNLNQNAVKLGCSPHPQLSASVHGEGRPSGVKPPCTPAALWAVAA